MLGFSYLFKFTLQHFFFFGFLILLLGEVLMKGNELMKEKSLPAQMFLIGLSLMNLSFLHFSFTEELFLVQLVLFLFYFLLSFLKPYSESGERLKIQKNRFNFVYFFLLILLSVELID